MELLQGEQALMPRFKPKGMLERDPLADLWKHTLSRIPSIYGRLVYLASLRDPNSGFYRHHGLGLAFGREDSARALRESHEQVFVEWLSLPLPSKSSDLKEYLAGLEENSAVVAATWLRSGHYRNLVPDRATRAQKAQFLQESGTLLEMIRNAYGAGSPFPGSAQPA
jgi:hypothetical protein